MEQVRSLESLVNDVIAEMERRGNADNTIVRHKRAYSQFCEYAQSKGQEYYSSDLTKAFLAEKEKLLPCRGPRFMEQYHIALNKLSDAAQGQELSLRHLQNGYHLELSRFDWVIPPFADRLNGRLKNANDVKVRLRILSMFLSFVEGQGVNELKAISINHIAAAFEAATDKAHFCCVIREFLHFAADMEWMPTDLSYFVPKARRHKTVPTVYSTADIETCLSSIDRTTRSGRRTYAVLLMSPTAKLLRQYTSERKAETEGRELPLFINQRGEAITPACIRNVICKYVSKAKKTHPDLFCESSYSPHSFRHSKAVHLLEAGTELIYIRDFLGHASIQTTEIYATVSQSTLMRTIRERDVSATPPAVLEDIPNDTVPAYLKRK